MSTGKKRAHVCVRRAVLGHRGGLVHLYMHLRAGTGALARVEQGGVSNDDETHIDREREREKKRERARTPPSVEGRKLTFCRNVLFARSSFRGILWKAARIGERLSPWVGLVCIAAGIGVLLR